MSPFRARLGLFPAAAFTAVACGCASRPPITITEGEDEIFVTASADHVFSGTMESVRCTLSNDKGTWTAMTPSLLRVERSSQPMHVTCAKEGYATVEYNLVCWSPRERAKAVDNFGMAMSVAIVPAAILTAPLFPPLAAMELAEAGIMGGTSAARQAADDMCTYGGVRAIMKRPK